MCSFVKDHTCFHALLYQSRSSHKFAFYPNRAAPNGEQLPIFQIMPQNQLFRYDRTSGTSTLRTTTSRRRRSRRFDDCGASSRPSLPRKLFRLSLATEYDLTRLQCIHNHSIPAHSKRGYLCTRGILALLKAWSSPSVGSVGKCNACQADRPRRWENQPILFIRRRVCQTNEHSKL